MSEILKPTPHALVARFTYEDDSLKHALEVTQYGLTPGNGIVFYGDEDRTSVAASFQQSDLEYVMRTLVEGNQTLQFMGLLDMQDRGLLLMHGFKDRWGINSSIPKDQRFLGIDYGRMQFTGIWGESRQEVSETLRRLQEARAKLN